MPSCTSAWLCCNRARRTRPCRHCAACKATTAAPTSAASGPCTRTNRPDPGAVAVLPDFVEALSDGLFTIDTGFERPHFDAAYLIVERGRAAFVDTGTNHAVPRLLATLQALNVERSAVDWVIPTHVHLDHAGGAG